MIKFKTNLKSNLLLITIVITAIIFGAFLFVTGKMFSNQTIRQSKELAHSEAARYAMLSKDYFDFDMGLVKSLAGVMQYTGNFSQNDPNNKQFKLVGKYYLDEQDESDTMSVNDSQNEPNSSDENYSLGRLDTIYGNMMLQMLRMNPKYISVWGSMELKYYHREYQLDHGRKLLVSMRQGSKSYITFYMRDMDSLNRQSDYYTIREKNEPTLAEPYIDPDIGNFYITSVIYPVNINGGFAGLSGIDIPLETLQEFINNMKLYKGSSAFVISNTGIIVGHSDTSKVGKNITEIYPEVKNSLLFETCWKFISSPVCIFSIILKELFSSG